ncbi:hypothetical protein IAU59_005719 [Kwoniella sp. CBS 9459]
MASALALTLTVSLTDRAALRLRSLAGYGGAGPSSLQYHHQNQHQHRHRHRIRIPGACIVPAPRRGYHACGTRREAHTAASDRKSSTGFANTDAPSRLFKPRAKSSQSSQRKNTNLSSHSSSSSLPQRTTQHTTTTTTTATAASSSSNTWLATNLNPNAYTSDRQWPWRPIPISNFEKRFKSRMKPDPSPKSSGSESAAAAAEEGGGGGGGQSGQPEATEYRLIFSRPLPSSPWKRILLATGLTWLGCVWFVIPDKPKIEGLDGNDVGYGTYLAGTTANFLLDQIPFIALAGAVLSLNKTLRLLRVVTRLEQVRAPSSNDSSVAQRVWVRMRTGRSTLDGLVPSKKEYRDVEIGDVTLSGMRSTQGPVLDLKITPADPSKTASRIRDRRPYWMDLRDSPKAALDAERSGKDYVVSLNRLQQVFGKIDLGN